MLYDLDRPMNFCNLQILFLRLVRGTREILQRLLLEQLSFLISSMQRWQWFSINNVWREGLTFT